MSYSVMLPQAELVFRKPLPAAMLLMAAGGRPPAAEWFLKIATKAPLWCIDSGIQICRQAGITPARIIGDGDSASPAAWTWGKSLGVPVEVYPADKDYTDFQLALLRARDMHGPATAVVTGVWGGRFDHAFSNIQSLAGWEALGGKGIAADESEVLFFIADQDTVRIKADAMPDIISLISLSDCCLGVTIDGVRWPLQKTELQRNLPYAISNQPLGDCQEVTVAVTAGLLGIYLQWQHDK
ncbi:thiamine diphosphokinase [Sporomusa termitida]|uniref:Thiamine diphosphokinase n=1 Tax=Sporomusa termitida TaxID=2377 RepID=A0A517DR39_9FIRM|nr:thiamine diphosphokinase [Sporomusa termitida]QDR79815.1 thiamine pyrophosphokinase [Sporomusa termitida]